MATAPSDRIPVTGRVDAAGRLVTADPRLEALQIAAGGALGRPLALPQIAAIARLAADLNTPVSRPAVAAAADYDLDLWVRAAPDGTGVTLVIDGWIEQPAAGPKLGSLLGNGAGDPIERTATSWTVDEELRLVSVAPELAAQVEISPEEAIGQPLTRFLKLEEDEGGEMPMLAALAARRSFTGQRARPRSGGGPLLVLTGEVLLGPSGAFAGFQGSVEGAGSAARSPRVSFDEILDEALRSPLDLIIEQAERIVAQSEGPLQADYAAYGNDIAAAARHLLSVIQSMNAGSGEVVAAIDLAHLAEEAAVMLESAAEERKISIQLEASRRLPAHGDERAVIQILVNLIGNAIRHSPLGGTVGLRFLRTPDMAVVVVEDQGPGIAPEDEERIFEPFERASDDDAGTGLGLAISRRLARSMGGDVCLDSTARPGARFRLELPTG
ncbi:MAG: HAMP domain-containing sensor histidine kinase [Sphingomicrobium sp.]